MKADMEFILKCCSDKLKSAGRLALLVVAQWNNKNQISKNKIEGTPILKLAMVKRLKVKNKFQKNQNSKKNSSPKIVT